MRRVFLFRSINRVLGDAVTVHEAAYMWARHRWMIPYAAVVFAAVLLLAPIAGINDWATRVVIGGAAVAVAVTATTEYRVLARVDERLAILKASRIRQVATGFDDYLPADAVLELVGGTVLATDWQVGKHRYSVPRAYEQAMSRLAADHIG